MPVSQRTPEARQLLKNCIGFVLLHEVCFSSHNKDEYLHRNIDKLTFPTYGSDFLEILWLLTREGIKNEGMVRAITLLQSKKQTDGTWVCERPVHNLTTTVGQKGRSNLFITKRAAEVLDFWGE